jgi:DNA-binding LacI/PurR family transcriptional regulator
MGGSGARRSTMAVVAQAAGVSVPTVSKVLNGRSDVAPATRERVERLLAEHGYRRPGTSRRRDHRSTLIDLVVGEPAGAACADLVSGVSQVAEAAGLSVVVSTARRGAMLTRQWLDALDRRGSDGAVLALGELTGEQRAELDRRSVSFVVVDALRRPDPDLPSVGTTNWAGGFDATRHLLGLGHRRIAAIGGPPGIMSTRARLGGYRAAIEEAGLPLEPGLVWHGELRYEGGHRAAAALLDLALPPTAVVAGDDLQALGAIQAAWERGLRVPEDLSVVGFDDLMFSRWIAPPLTTVRQPVREMGAAAARMLLGMMRGEAPSPPRIELATTLVIRQSTAVPGGGRDAPKLSDHAPHGPGRAGPDRSRREST